MEYPKALYHPKDGNRYQIVASIDQEQQLLESWGVVAVPKITLSSSPVSPAAPIVEEKPKAKRGRKPKIPQGAQ